MDANISFTGNLGTDVDFVRKDNWCGARFRVAQTPRYMRDGAWIDGETTWLSVRVNGRLAENCKNSLTKGDPVVVVGRLRTQVWTTPEGVQREQQVVQAVSVGHDLQRGRSQMIRPAPRPEEAPITDPTGRLPDADQAEDAPVPEETGPLAEGPAEVGQMVVDHETGEVLEG